jgi:hypothetical protein
MEYFGLDFGKSIDAAKRAYAAADSLPDGLKSYAKSAIVAVTGSCMDTYLHSGKKVLPMKFSFDGISETENDEIRKALDGPLQECVSSCQDTLGEIMNSMTPAITLEKFLVEFGDAGSAIDTEGFKKANRQNPTVNYFRERDEGMVN